MIYLLDTNAWIAYLRQSNPALLQKVRQTDPCDIRLCSVVLAELYYGAYHGPPAFQAHNLALLAALRQQFISLAFDDAAAEQYGQIRADLAAIALANGLTVVTHNTVEFSRVAGLLVDDWQV